jgi:hypothetical protein
MVLKAAKPTPKPHTPQAWPPSIASVVQNHDPTDHHCGQGHQNSDVRQLPAAASPVPSMPMVVVNGPDFVR